MTKAEKTKKMVIEKSAPIFNKKGYDNTSMADIQEVTHLSRGALYGNFSNKEELIIEAFDYNYLLSKKRTEEALLKVDSYKEKLLEYSASYIKDWQGVLERGGCPMLNAAVEADDYLICLRDKVRVNIKDFIGILQNIIEAGKLQLEFKTEINAEKYATLIFSIMEGNIMLAKIMNDKKYLQLADESIEDIINNQISQ